MRHFSHSIFITEPDSVIRIIKFQDFWIFWNLWNLSVKKQIMGIFYQNQSMMHFSHSIFITELDSVIRITKLQEIHNFVTKFLLICGKIPEITKNSKFLEFCDSDYRIRFSDENWVGKMCHTLILVENAHNLIFCGEIP